MLSTPSNVEIIEIIDDLVLDEEEIFESVSGVFTPDQIDSIMSLVEKIDIYSDYIMGFFLFFILVILLYFIYRFFKICF